MTQHLDALILSVYLCTFAGSTWAATYVVSPLGSDTNPGTVARPFQTIAKAADVARAGDKVVVRPGTYREEVHLRQSGTPTAPIQFIADPPGSALVTGADVVTSWTRVLGDAPIYSIPWNHVFAIDYHDGKPIEFHPDSAPLWGRAEQVIADGKQLLPSAGLDGLGKAWTDHAKTPGPTVPSPLPHLGGTFVGSFAADTLHKRLYVWLADGSDPNMHKMEASTRSQTFGVNQWESHDGVQYIQVRGFCFRYGASFPQRSPVSLFGAHNLMEDCVVEQMAGSGVAVGGTMRRCVVRGCGHTGGSAGGDGFVNEQCLWEGNSWKPIDRGWEAGGVKIAVTNGGLFRRCVFRRNGGPGLWFDIDMRGVRVTQCVFQENEGAGVMVEISRHNQIDHCLAVGNAVGAVGAPDGVWASGGVLLAESQDCVVTNNTCVGNKDGITFREQGPRPLDTPDGNIPYHDTRDVVTNNLCADNKGYSFGLWSDNFFFGRHPNQVKQYPTEEAFTEFIKTVPDKVYDPTKQALTIDHNLYWPAPDKPVALYGAPWHPRHQEFLHLADFTARTGFDAHSEVTNPLFVSTVQGDYRVKPNSHARAAGAGWLDAPANVDTWMAAWLPKWR